MSDKDRERSRDRPSGTGSHAHTPSSGSGGALSFLPNLFGRRAPTVATSRQNVDVIRSGERRGSNESGASSLASRLKPVPMPDAKRAPSPHPEASFHLQSSMELMDQKEGISEAELCEIIKATAVWLADLMIDQETGTGEISARDIRHLYRQAIRHANPRGSKHIRTATKRLLAALITIAPPGGDSGFIAVDLPDPINSASLYKIITSAASSNTKSIHPSIEEIYVEVGALKALTKNGVEVDGTEGIVGWLIRTLHEIEDTWVKWCEKKEEEAEWDDSKRKNTPFAPIRPASPAEAAGAIIDLVAAIISAHASLFSFDDLRRIVAPMFSFFWSGALAELRSPRLLQVDTSLGLGRGRRDSAIVTSPTMVSTQALGIEPGLRRAASIKKNQSPSSKLPHRQSSATDSMKSPNSPAIASSPMATPVYRRKWSRLMVSFAAFFEILTKSVAIPTEVFKEAVAVACLVLGQDQEEDASHEAEVAASDLIQLILGQAAGRRGENAVRMVLEGRTAAELKLDVAKDILIDCCATRGAVIASHTLLGYLDGPASTLDVNAACAMASLAPSLLAAQSTSRFGKDALVKHESWDSVDSAVLGLLQTHLNKLENLPTGNDKIAADAWTEGQAACDILDGLLPVVLASQQPNLKELRLATGSSQTVAQSEVGYRTWLERKNAEGSGSSILLPLFEAVIHQLPKSIAHLHTSSSSSPAYYHPRYIDLLLKLGTHLDEDDAGIVIDYYQRECLCLPFTSGWTNNIWKLIRAFFLVSSPLEEARKRVTKLLFVDVAGFAHDMPEYRVELIDLVLIPFLQQYLVSTTDEVFQKSALSVLVNAAVAETQERDEERREFRAQQAASANAEEDASAEASSEVTEATFAGSFNAIRSLIAEVAHIPCKEESVPVAMSASMTESISGSSLNRSSSGRVKEPNLRALRGSISPPTRARELPTISSIAGVAPMAADEQSSPPPVHQYHADCRSIQAVLSLISIFTKLCFSPSFHNTTNTKAVRMPASFRSIIIFRDLLGLLYPMTDDRPRHTNTPTQVKMAARCPRARIVILEWLMRLRADNHHRLFVRRNIDEAALPFAAMLRRTRDTEAEARASEAEESRRRSRPSQQTRAQEEDRGRASRSQESSTRSRSRSKAAPIVRGVDHTYNPLWNLPQEELFDVPPNDTVSEIMTTYNPAHPALQDPTAKPIDGVWLPVSQYVRVLNGILRGHDWELVSYVLCFLPLQLRNKVFFHGKRAVAEVRALVRVLAEGVLGVVGNWEKRYNVPTFIKRVDINAIAYQSLSILIAYRGTMARDECDQLVQAFADGLQGRKDLAKPCLQALTLCIFELEQYVGRHLLTIIDRMERIVTTNALAIHILEFLIALGHNGSLYRNFTDEQYRRVFHVAIDYITIHNARSDEPIDLSKSREDYTLSQHVIGLAYYSIYIWFLALKLPQRPNLVPEITRKLLQGRSKRVMVDEMAEVCFDWLSRYTYGNADPRPATSFLSETVMQDARESEVPKSVSWLLGGAILTITAHARSGWATVTSTRPTGSTSVVSKLENVPLLELGESNADLISLPAFLMANRDVIAKAGGSDSAEHLAKTTSTMSSPEAFDPSSQHGFIWSGATPSQRRKDVVIHPSYLGVQLLSSYPNQSLETPRGQLIPPEPKFQRALQGIQNTPVIDTVKIAVLYVAPGQSTETEILGNIDGSPLYLDFLSGIGRLIKLKGQVDVFVGGLNRTSDSDGEYAYAWWDDFDQVIFHTPTMMPNHPDQPGYDSKKRLVGNDFVKIVYNESGRDFAFDTIRTAWNFVNVVITPLTLGEGTIIPESYTPPSEDGWPDWDREEWFKVDIQRAPGIPEFGPLGEGKLVSRHALPILVRQLAHLGNDLAARYMHIKNATDAESAEYISSWRSRLRAMSRLREMMPKFELPDQFDETTREEMRRDFTRQFTYRPSAAEK